MVLQGWSGQARRCPTRSPDVEAPVAKAKAPGCDAIYLFARVGGGRRSVYSRPNCGNMLAGVAPFALEQGLVPAGNETTTVRVFNVNTRSRIDVTVQTPGRRVT